MGRFGPKSEWRKPQLSERTGWMDWFLRYCDRGGQRLLWPLRSWSVGTWGGSWQVRKTFLHNSKESRRSIAREPKDKSSMCWLAILVSCMSSTMTSHEGQATRLTSSMVSLHAGQPALNTSTFRRALICFFTPFPSFDANRFRGFQTARKRHRRVCCRAATHSRKMQISAERVRRSKACWSSGKTSR
jgi:hypothetical protein